MKVCGVEVKGRKEGRDLCLLRRKKGLSPRYMGVEDGLSALRLNSPQYFGGKG